MRKIRTIALTVAGLVLPAGLAQTGVLDQSSPHDPVGGNSAAFNVGVDILTWQQQIRCGVAGRLEGIRLILTTGVAGSTVHVRVRRGAAPSGQPVLVDDLATKATSDTETLFVDMQGANITFAVGDVFVMEMQGNENVWLIGSYVPPPGTPLYPEPLFLNGQLFVDDHWRFGFDTFMLTGQQPCPGDLNHDHQVGLSDLTILLAHFGVSGTAGGDDGDLDGDHDVDLSDLTAFLARFGSTCS